MRSILKEALRKKYEGEIAEANANLQVYFHNPVGIGEHPEIITEMDKQLEKIAAAKEKLEVLLDAE
tara:strand:- start:304 stop:501 length:198 start_codon:yes stop_codon:yes gene_type:complete